MTKAAGKTRIVMKFGGTSVGDLERIKNVAGKVKRRGQPGNRSRWWCRPCPGVTNQLVDYCATVAPLYDAREYDAVVAPASRSHAGCSRSRCRNAASRRAPGPAGRFRFAPTMRTARRASPISTRRDASPHGPGRSPWLPAFRASTRTAASPRSAAAVGHLGGRARRGAEGRPLRHLYRCRRRLHHRSAHRAERAQAR